MGSASQTLRRLAFFALRLHAVQLKELWLLSCCCQEGLFASACQEGLALPRAAAKKSFATCQQPLLNNNTACQHCELCSLLQRAGKTT